MEKNQNLFVPVKANYFNRSSGVILKTKWLTWQFTEGRLRDCLRSIIFLGFEKFGSKFWSWKTLTFKFLLLQRLQVFPSSAVVYSVKHAHEHEVNINVYCLLSREGCWGDGTKEVIKSMLLSFQGYSHFCLHCLDKCPAAHLFVPNSTDAHSDHRGLETVTHTFLKSLHPPRHKFSSALLAYSLYMLQMTALSLLKLNPKQQITKDLWFLM